MGVSFVNLSPSVFDVSALKCVERTCREQLGTCPDNMELRMRLAWCLFLQALHQAGQEQGRGALAASLPPSPAGGYAPSLLDGDAQALLEDCLHQTYTVMHLSAQAQDHWDVEKLQALVQLSGASSAVLQAEDRARHILEEITGDMLPQSKARRDTA